MKILRLFKFYYNRLMGGVWLVHRTDLMMIFEIKATAKTYTFRRNGIVIGTFTQEIEAAEMHAQKLQLEAMRTQCLECSHIPYMEVNPQNNPALTWVICPHQLKQHKAKSN